MTSDSRTIPAGLRKYECRQCHLIRNGYPFSYERLLTHYGEDYVLGEHAAIAEPLMFTPSEPLPRSYLTFQWLAQALDSIGFAHSGSLLEVGCGEGSLLKQFSTQWPECQVRGLDMSARSVDAARANGLDVAVGSYRDVTGSYDLIYSFTVLEHVPSPSDFLARLRAHLKEGGILLTAQPCQDRGSYDIFFSDHLHHFFSQHVAMIGAKTGLKEVVRSTSNPYFQDLSLHLFTTNDADSVPSPKPEIDPVRAIDDSLHRWQRIFRDIDRWLETHSNRDLAVWGVGQTFVFLSTYTNLRTSKIQVGFDDNPDRYAESNLPFPVIKLETGTIKDPSRLAVLLTFIPGAAVLDRLSELGIEYYIPLNIDDEN